ncbi:MAG: DUF3570 domain-containing protein, partial [Prosthecobacter sp.]
MNHTPPSSYLSRCRLLVLLAVLHVYLSSSALAETFFDTRYQYYQEDNGRVRVDSDYSLFSIDLSDTLMLDGTLLYSAITGASPTGLPPDKRGGQVPLVFLEDERYAATLGLTKQLGKHSLKIGGSYSYESDYLSLGTSVQDTISLNEKNTELVLGFAYTHDTVGANGSDLSARKQSFDWMIGVNQLLGPNTLLTLNAGIGYKRGYLSDPYKRVLIDGEVFDEERPHRKLEQILFGQVTHFIEPWDASVEFSYRFGHNDHGINSHTTMLAFYKYFFDKRLVIRPSFRYYRQSEADYYDTEFSGYPNFYSSDYRVSAEESFNLGLQVRWFVVPDKFSIDLGYERYISRGTDGRTSQSA